MIPGSQDTEEYSGEEAEDELRRGLDRGIHR
jgi:hypothetical protein